MILADSNVISEPLRRVPEPRVAVWLDARALESLYLSALTVVELRFGVRSLPAGRRRGRLHESLENRVLPMFAGRVLAFDLAASHAYARLMARARFLGTANSTSDAFIAGVAAANGKMVAKRDAVPFEATGLKIIDPWTA